MVVISIGMILICGSVFAITAVVNSNYEKESIEKSSKVINNNVEENLDSIYSKSDTEVISRIRKSWRNWNNKQK